MSSIRMPKQSRRRVSERKEIFPNANKFHAKCELAMKWLHMEHRLLGLGERRLLNKDTVPTEFVHRKKSLGPSGVAMACEERSRKRDKHNVCKYRGTINGVLEYHSMYFLYNNKNQ